jgi:glycosyltransferase involved in cell wall biosynthesis
VDGFKKRILFISHSDIAVDSRILKQISLSEFIGFEPLALGVKDLSRNFSKHQQNIQSIDLYFRISASNHNSKLRFFFLSFFRFVLMSSEVFFRFIPRAIRFKPQIIHCSDYLFLPLAVLLKLLTGSKLIYDAHELESQTNSISKMQSTYVLYLEKILWPFIDFTFYVSEAIKDWYETNVGEKKSEVILNSPVMPAKVGNSNYFRSYFQISEEIKIFIYLGMLSRGRGINMAIDVFKELENSVAIIFMGHGEKEQEVKEFSKTLSNVFIHPPVPHEKVVEITSSADYGYCMLENASLSDYFCLPNKLFEYAFSGIPVLASNFPDISKVVKQYNLGVVSNSDKVSIQTGISRLTSEGRYNFLNKDITPLSWQHQCEKLKRVFNELQEG